MGVYIRGMEMPKSCHDCEMSALVDVSDGLAYGCQALKEMIFNNRERLPNCPLVPVPPHGRAIDADLLCKVLQKNSEDEWNNKTAPFSWAYAYDCVKDIVEDMPTIIPSSKEGEA